MKNTWIVLALLLAPRVAAADTTFGLSIAVAQKDGAPVRDEAWVASQITEANALFSRAGVSFRWTLVKELAAAHTEMHTRDDRDALSALTEPRGVVDIFLVAALEDVDEPGRMRKGVCWTHRPDGKRYIVLSAEAPKQVLAHELGHFFGNPHTTVPDNLMSYSRTGGDVSFDDSQIDKIRSFSRRFLDSGRLTEAPVLRLLP
jgi:hypothetical protein